MVQLVPSFTPGGAFSPGFSLLQLFSCSHPPVGNSHCSVYRVQFLSLGLRAPFVLCNLSAASGTT